MPGRNIFLNLLKNISYKRGWVIHTHSFSKNETDMEAHVTVTGPGLPEEGISATAINLSRNPAINSACRLLLEDIEFKRAQQLAYSDMSAGQQWGDLSGHALPHLFLRLTETNGFTYYFKDLPDGGLKLQVNHPLLNHPLVAIEKGRTTHYKTEAKRQILQDPEFIAIWRHVQNKQYTVGHLRA